MEGQPREVGFEFGEDEIVESQEKKTEPSASPQETVRGSDTESVSDQKERFIRELHSEAEAKVALVTASLDIIGSAVADWTGPGQSEVRQVVGKRFENVDRRIRLILGKEEGIFALHPLMMREVDQLLKELQVSIATVGKIENFSDEERKSPRGQAVVQGVKRGAGQQVSHMLMNDWFKAFIKPKWEKKAEERLAELARKKGNGDAADAGENE